MAHVKQVTIEVDGRYYNVPSVRSGKPIPKSEFVGLIEGKGYATEKEADAANRAESVAAEVKRRRAVKNQVAAVRRNRASN